MKPGIAFLMALLAAPLALAEENPADRGLVTDPDHVCEPCAEWNQPRDPLRLFGNTWSVGPAGLGALLLTSDKGHILIDGGLPQSAPLIAGNLRRLGFKLTDIKLIVNSHVHYDHAGGIAALQRASGAPVAASPKSMAALERGGPTEEDPQFAFGHQHNDFAPVKNLRPVKDGETLRVGDIAITAHFTPGHTPGGTTWSWKDCEGDGAARRCLDLVYADSLNSVSAPGFRFSGSNGAASRVAEFQRSIDTVEKLPCDILWAAHPTAIDFDSKLAKLRETPRVNPFIDAGACKAYAAGARQRLVERLAEEGRSK